MRVLWPILQDPPDILIQGEVIGDAAIGDMSVDAFDAYEGPAYQRQVIQGDIQTAWIPEPTIPRGLVGQSDLYGVPKWTGPKVYAGGVIDNVSIGPAPVDWMLVPEQKLILAGIPQGIGPDGAMNSPEIEALGAPEAHTRMQMLFEANAFSEAAEIAVPRAEVARRNPITYPTLPERYGQLLTPKRFDESTVPYTVVVTVRDEASALVIGATVWLMGVDLITTGPAPTTSPINQQGISDANGQVFFTVSYWLVQQLMGWKAGSPNKGGVSIYTTNGDNTLTLYIKDPTIPGGGGPGGSGISRGRIVNAGG